MAARIEADFPEYQPVASMAAAALALEKRVSPLEDASREELLDVVAAHDKVAAYLTPKLKAIEHTGAGGGPLQVVTGVATDAGL